MNNIRKLHFLGQKTVLWKFYFHFYEGIMAEIRRVKKVYISKNIRGKRGWEGVAEI